MILIPEDVFEKVLPERYNNSTIKFISIGELFYALDFHALQNSREYRALKTGPLYITNELLDSFPPPRYNPEVITKELILSLPVVMFESTVDQGRYWRFDRQASYHFC